ncbi:WW domain binding protein 1-like [Actinia tenebrosa]|uniref:WW domain binding protein 1-like n=1 Tax=Actinia tenebrosa TaxID=6105 RepID=A0A6P8I7V5_ACTTE|nr:WW domain binding protein 1-like [Actinia tenebrosa]
MCGGPTKMAGDTRLGSFFKIQLIYSCWMFIKNVDGYHCHPDWCNYNEYCCGDDMCCDYLTGYWYIWLIGGVMIFSFTMVCCWMRCFRLRSQESHDHPKGYVSYGLTSNYGEPLYVHQQPHGHYYGAAPTEMQYIATSRKGDIPQTEEEARLRSAAYYPPPYTYVERKPPTAPPYEP